jgi:dUTP pyrophosphatase
MHIKILRSDILIPERSTAGAMAYDVFMPEAGVIYNREVTEVFLGFALALPPGWGAIMVPRSGMGAKFGVELNNTNGLIDEDFRGEWRAFLRLKQLEELRWKKHDRLLQFTVVPVLQIPIQVVDELPPTGRSSEGFGSTGK